MSAEDGTVRGAPAGPGPLLAALAVIACCVAAIDWRYAPPAARDEGTPAGEFSAARAGSVLDRLLTGEGPHPTGTAANQRVRERVLAELRGLGLRPEVERRLSCRRGRCAEVVNLLARLPGRGGAGEGAVLVATHYDSVAAGPGASDAATSVAVVVESARALLAGPRPRRDVWLLIDDGEEQALLGAEAFVRERLAGGNQPVAAVVNLEARGTTGPSLLFELSPGNHRLVAAAAGALRRPVTNSVYYTIYQQLPNDTDLTVFKAADLPGVNFAFVGGAMRYHTPRDDLAHADRRTLQHHGDNALAMVRALADGEGGWAGESDAVFFDLLAWTVVRWPASWTVPLALVALLLVATAGWWGWQGGAAPLLWALLAAVALPLLAGGATWSLLAALRAGGRLPYQWLASGWGLELAAWGSAVASCGAVALVLGRRLERGAVWAVAWGGWALLGLALALAAPGLAYPFVTAGMVAGVAGLVPSPAGRAGAGARPGATLPPLAAASLLLLPLAWMLYDGMGTPALAGVSALVALVLLGVLPSLATAGRTAQRSLLAGGGAALLAGALVVAFSPAFTRAQPQPAALVLLHDAAAGGSQWVVSTAGGPLPPALAGLGFGAAPAHPYPWAPEATAWVAPAGVPMPPAPALEEVAIEASGEGLRVRARLVSTRGAPWAGVLAPARRWLGAEVAGADAMVPVDDPLDAAADDDRWQGVEHVTLPAAGAELDLRFRGDEPLELWVWDGGPGLGPAGAPLVRARPEWAVPIHRGDRTLTARLLVIAPPQIAPPLAAAQRSGAR